MGNGKADIFNFFLLLPISKTMIVQLFSCFTMVGQLYAAKCKNVFPKNCYRFLFLLAGWITLYIKFLYSVSKNKQQYIEQEYDSMTHETDTVLHTSK